MTSWVRVELSGCFPARPTSSLARIGTPVPSIPVWSVGGRLLPIEVKTTRSLGTRDLRGLAAFLDEYPGLAPFGVVLHAGDEWFTPARNVVAIPWTSMLGY